MTSRPPRRAAGSPGLTAPPGPVSAGEQDRARPLLAPSQEATPANASRGPRARDVLAATMSEAQLEEHVRALCRGLGILRFHVRDSRGMNRGWPDDTLIGSRGILFRELKAQRGRVTPEQKAVGDALTALGYDFAVWRPASLLDGTIARSLAAISGIAAGGRGNHPAGTRRLTAPGGGDDAA